MLARKGTGSVLRNRWNRGKTWRHGACPLSCVLSFVAGVARLRFVPQLQSLPSVPGQFDSFSQKFVRGATEVLPLQLRLSFFRSRSRKTSVCAASPIAPQRTGLARFVFTKFVRGATEVLPLQLRLASIPIFSYTISFVLFVVQKFPVAIHDNFVRPRIEHG